MKDREQRRALILHLRDVEGLSFAAIGRQFGMSLQGARQIYLRAIQRKPRKPHRKPFKYQSSYAAEPHIQR